jgi:hypothetical protein
MNQLKRKKQTGIYSVEFALVGLVFFTLLFAVLEVGRLFFVWNVLTEASRRGARLASVCDLDRVYTQPLVDMKVLALFDNVGLVPGLEPSILHIEYLQLNGTAATDFSSIALVRAEIIDYEHDLIIPGFFITLNSPKFSTTLPKESLGDNGTAFPTKCVPS